MGCIVSCIDALDRESVTFLESRGVKDIKRVLKTIKQDSSLSKRLETVIHGDVIIKVEESFFDHCFGEFCDRAPQWSPGCTMGEFSSKWSIFWAKQSEEWRKKVLIIRQQTAGMCSLIAIFVFEHYMMALLSGIPVTTTYDVGKYQAETLRGDFLEDFFLKGTLNSILGTLESLCRIEKRDVDIITLSAQTLFRAHYEEECDYILRRLAEQPAILAQVMATHISSSTDQVVFTDPPLVQPDYPRHAMLLIGARKGHDGEYYFLVQNWWQSRHFLELSGCYLASCDAKIISLKPSTKLERKEGFEELLNDAIFAETSADVCDSCPEN